MIIPDRFYQIAIAALLVAVGLQQVRIAHAHTQLALTKQDHAEVLSRISELTSESLAAALAAQSAHATQTQENENAFRKLQTSAAAAAVSERAAVQRLRDRSAAYSHVVAAPGETCPATVQRAGDRLDALGALAVEGDGLLQEARELIRQRDGEVTLVLRQIAADRKAIESAP